MVVKLVQRIRVVKKDVQLRYSLKPLNQYTRSPVAHSQTPIHFSSFDYLVFRVYAYMANHYHTLYGKQNVTTVLCRGLLLFRYNQSDNICVESTN